MPFTISSFDPTPNPNAVKCILDRPISDRPRSFRSAEEANADPIARALFAIPGVACILMNGGWVTINKTTDHDWSAVRAGVRDVLAAAP